MESLTDAAFDRTMARLAPFEPEPELAVAVSGGADSLALALLADRWARTRGGRITALTVDHGLRRESAAEARQVGRWLKALGIKHRVLRWKPPATSGKSEAHAPATAGKTQSRESAKTRMANLQAAARDARYDLLLNWCRDRGVLHLLLAHHRDDQAETLLLRLARGSGLEGLAAMAPLVERGPVRLLRPLLQVPKSDLTAFLTARGQAWIEDPSNRDPANARVRMRRLLPRLAEEGMTIARLAETADRLAVARAAVDATVARLLARAAAIYPEGYLRLDTAALRSAEREIGLRALARAIACIGGSPYGPRLERLTRLYDLLREGSAGGGAGLGRGRTLGGCRILPIAKGDSTGTVLVVREPAAVQPAVKLPMDQATIWDGRFTLCMNKALRVSWSVGALGEDDWRKLQRAGLQAPVTLPRDVIVTLPALRSQNALRVVPHLGYAAGTTNMKKTRNMTAWQVQFAPLSPLTKPGFTLV